MFFFATIPFGPGISPPTKIAPRNQQTKPTSNKRNFVSS